jgi:hypothetical protein
MDVLPRCTIDFSNFLTNQALGALNQFHALTKEAKFIKLYHLPKNHVFQN